MKMMIFALVTLLLAAGSASARLPYEYDVTGIAKTDTLNIRQNVHHGSKPGDAKIVGTIPWNAKGVLGTGKFIRIKKAKWLEIRYRNLRGWVNGAYLKPLPRKGAIKFPTALHCTGTEPFWSLKFRDKSAEHKIVGGAKARYSVTRSRKAFNRRDTWVLSLKKGGKAGTTLALMVNTDRCSDDMSNLIYPIHLYLLWPEKRPLTGCCTVVR